MFKFFANRLACLDNFLGLRNQSGKYLHYLIRFENTGTTVINRMVLKTVIDTADYDPTTVEILDSSHPFFAEQSGNVVELKFSNMQLSIIGGGGGHGHIIIKCRTKPSLQTNEQVAQKVNIYYEQKAPLITTDAITIFGTLSKDDLVKDNEIGISPNPTQNNIRLNTMQFNTLKISNG